MLLSANPALQGKHALEVLDAVIDALANQGLLVILDNHRSRGIGQQYMTEKDLAGAVWALNGTQGAGYGRSFGADETFGVLKPQWTGSASDAYTTALQALMPAKLGL